MKKVGAGRKIGVAWVEVRISTNLGINSLMPRKNPEKLKHLGKEREGGGEGGRGRKKEKVASWWHVKPGCGYHSGQLWCMKGRPSEL